MTKNKPAICTVVRQTWGNINPVTRVKGNKKGKGSYDRQAFKKAE